MAFYRVCVCPCVCPLFQVSGHSVLRDFPRAARGLSVVSQEGALWDGLSARGHLELFARIKGAVAAQDAAWGEEIGYSSALVAARVDSTLAALGLGPPHASKAARSLSGGMRRKLAVGSALVGCLPRPRADGPPRPGPPRLAIDLLVLDEPSAGLDPASRRQLWAALQEALRPSSGKTHADTDAADADDADDAAAAAVFFQGASPRPPSAPFPPPFLGGLDLGVRAALLTTHALEEAEVLCSRVGVMVGGELKALGSPLQLRARFGGGYEVTLRLAPRVASKASASAAAAAVTKAEAEVLGAALFPAASHRPELEDLHGGLATFRVQMPRAELGPTFARLERAALETGGSHPGGGGGLVVVDYAVSQPTLEQAFLRFARAGPPQHRPPEPDDQEDLGTGAVTRCCGLDRRCARTLTFF